MKTERRHELQTNALAKELARWIDLVRPYSKPAVGVLVAAIVIAAVALFVTRQGSHVEASAWNAYYQATEGGRPGLDGLRAVADEQRGTSVEPWARIAWADGQLLFGSRLLFRGREEATQYLGRAIDAYVELQGDDQHEMIRQRATYGLARAYESLSRLDEARKAYLGVSGAYADMARNRAAVLDEQESRRFYDWLVQAKLPPPVSPDDPGVPGQKPDFSLGPAEDGKARQELGAEGAPLPLEGTETSGAPDGTDQGPAPAPSSAGSPETDAKVGPPVEPAEDSPAPAAPATADDADTPN